MTYRQPKRPRGHGRPPMRRRHILPALDMEARALAAGARVAQRLRGIEDGRRRRAVQSQYRGIVPRWYAEVIEARARRDAAELERAMDAVNDVMAMTADDVARWVEEGAQWASE